MFTCVLGRYLASTVILVLEPGEGGGGGLTTVDACVDQISIVHND